MIMYSKYNNKNNLLKFRKLYNNKQKFKKKKKFKNMRKFNQY